MLNAPARAATTASSRNSVSRPPAPAPGQAVALVEPAKRGRPGVVGIGLARTWAMAWGTFTANSCGGAYWQAMQAGAAVVAQVGDEMMSALPNSSRRHGGEDGAKASQYGKRYRSAVLAGLLWSSGRREHDFAIGQRLGVAKRQGFSVCMVRPVFSCRALWISGQVVLVLKRLRPHLAGPHAAQTRCQCSCLISREWCSPCPAHRFCHHFARHKQVGWACCWKTARRPCRRCRPRYVRRTPGLSA